MFSLEPACISRATFTKVYETASSSCEILDPFEYHGYQSRKLESHFSMSEDKLDT